MNGAQSLIASLVKSGVEVCFSNPGTSEMHFVAALDSVREMRGVLCLFEGVASGAADGYARMAEKPASTLFHLGPGMGNAIANLHNAQKGFTPLVNIVGEHATYHRQYEAPLTSNIEGYAAPFSKWLRVSENAADVGADAAEAIAASQSDVPGVATLLLPANTAWDDGGKIAEKIAINGPHTVPSDIIRAAARRLEKAKRPVMLVNGTAIREKGLEALARIREKTGAIVYLATFYPRAERGEGRVEFPKLPYFPDQIYDALDGCDELILVGQDRPVTFFAYPGKKSDCTPDGVEPFKLTTPADDQVGALEALADEVGAPAINKLARDPRNLLIRPELQSGELTPRSAGHAVAAYLPENAIIADESTTSGMASYIFTANAPKHDWLALTGGAIGIGIPMALGASVACPDRKVVNLQADGSGMYTIQGLWSIAREQCDVTTVIWNNRSYNILNLELHNVGAANDAGPMALSMLDLSNPDLDFCKLAEGMGIESMRSTTTEEFNNHFAYCMANKGPHLIEVII
jgi:acetolactate synthase-1/2/3 large subunit